MPIRFLDEPSPTEQILRKPRVVFEEETQTIRPPATKKQQILSSVFPEAYPKYQQTKAETGKGTIDVTQSLIDVLNLPTRAAGALRERGQLSDPETSFFRKEIAERKKSPEEFKTPALMWELLSDPTIWAAGGGRTIKEGARGAKVGKRTLEQMAESLTGMSEEALKATAFPRLKKQAAKWGITKGKDIKNIERVAKNADNIGQDIVSKLRNFTREMPEAKTASEAAKVLPPIDGDDFLRAVDDMKVKGPTLGPVSEFNKQLDDLAYQSLEFVGEGNMLSAEKARSLYQQLDDIIATAYNVDGSLKPGGKRTKTAVQKLRRWIANKLKSNAKQIGRQDYVSAIDGMHEKYRLADELNMYIRGSGTKAEEAAERFLKSLYGRPGKTSGARKRLAQALDDTFGSDFSETAKAWGIVRETEYVPGFGISPVGTGGVGSVTRMLPVTRPVGAALEAVEQVSRPLDVLYQGLIKPTASIAEKTGVSLSVPKYTLEEARRRMLEKQFKEKSKNDTEFQESRRNALKRRLESVEP